MLSAADQLRQIEAHLVRTGGIIRSDAIAETNTRDDRGSLSAILDYTSGHQLHVNLLMSVEPGYPLWVRYGFHLQDREGRCVFRYDNESHYPAMTTFPHHKHVGSRETPRESPQPTLHQVLAETIDAIGQD